MNRDRISELTKSMQGRPYKKVERRKEWVEFLDKHDHKSNMTNAEKEEIFRWATTTQYTFEELQTVIKNIK